MTLIEPSWDQARAAAAELGKFIGAELIEIKDAAGRVLVNDAKSLVALPTYETSAMDGYVVSGNGPWRLIGEIKAGAPYKGSLTEGQALGIATGAVIPEGAFGILRWENAKVEQDTVYGETEFRKDFRPAGQETKLDEVLINKGSKLTPGMVGLLAATGYDQVAVAIRPKVALLLLGDEIQLSGLPKDGLVRDSIGPQIPTWFEKLGCEVISIEYVSDDLELTISAIEKALKVADIVATTGGTADGPRDFLHTAIAKLNGKIKVDKVAVRPGHPQLLAEIAGRALIGLPGNPQSAVVALLTLGQPLVETMLGKLQSELPLISSDDQFEAQFGFTRLVLGNLTHGKFRAGEYLGSAMLRSLAHADGFAICTNPPTTLRWLGLPL
ncbi:MAG: molybdopterin molybdotransferase MoeA [Candidatus Nanopelagicaceae bacterium]